MLNNHSLKTKVRTNSLITVGFYYFQVIFYFCLNSNYVRMKDKVRGFYEL